MQLTAAKSLGASFDLTALGNHLRRYNLTLFALHLTIALIMTAAFVWSVAEIILRRSFGGIPGIFFFISLVIMAVAWFGLLTLYGPYPKAIQVGPYGSRIAFQGGSAWEHRWSDPKSRLLVLDYRSIRGAPAPMCIVGRNRRKIPISVEAFQALIRQAPLQGVAIDSERLTQGSLTLVQYTFLPGLDRL